MAERVVHLSLADPPAEATHWTAAMMAGEWRQRQCRTAHLARPWSPAASLSPVHALQGSQVCREAQRCGRALRRSAHAIGLSVDEKSQIQALDRRERFTLHSPQASD